MFFWEITEVLLSILIIAFLATQIIYPIIVNKPLFPVFRRKNSELDRALAEAKAAFDLTSKEEEIAVLKKIVDKKHKELENG